MKKNITAVVAASAAIIENNIPETHAAAVEFSYTTDGVTVVTRENLTTKRRTQALAHVMNAFRAAGWTFVPGRAVMLTAPDAVFARKKKAATATVAEVVEVETDAPALFPVQEAPVMAFSG
ncbi:hypothetical protein ACGF12_30540 [Kitasatospora sp. NPDC048296]|uniref:hypothetical protein n=1 Tax=Kitasatospora sp. NPDC048296 TaxID=3364048 RepID=UPI0037221B26